MNNRCTFLLAVLLAVALAAAPAAAQEHPHKAEHPAHADTPAAGDDLVAVAAEAGGFTTFLRAVEAAGLTAKLQGEGSFTVFAPTDEAFAKLPAGALDELLQPANKARLAGLLACHVVPGRLMAADVKTMKAASVAGQDLDIVVADGAVTVDGAKVVKADLKAANGVIHAIDAVIMPSAAAAQAPAAQKPKDHPAH